MIRWYADNSETKSAPHIAIPDIQLFGGIAADEDACSELSSTIKKIKSTYRKIPDFPLKWCFKDLEKEYEKRPVD